MKLQQYEYLYQQIKSLLSNEHNLIANLANISALIHAQFNHHWVGFYLCEEEELVLGPFQGPVACTRIKKNKGVCGTAWHQMKTIIVPDVHAFEGHIACSSLSNSEIVVPIILHDRIMGVLDIDSVEFNTFDEEDKNGLEAIALLIAGKYLS